MANSQRRRLDSSGRTFMPMNMDISDNDEFMTLPKVIIVFLVFASYIVWIMWGKNAGLSLFGWLLTFVILTFVDQLLLRYIVFQEKYYYKIWQRDRALGDPKASIFWNIASIRKTSSGDILVYSDMKLGCMLELEKDTIIGRESDNMEKHFDAWSEFYKQLHLLGFKYVQMNIMEPAGKDVRLDELADIASNAKNEGVRTVLEYATGYMKEISRATLNEKDYLLIYTTNTNKMNTLISDVMDIAGKLLDGAYASVRIMTASEIYQLPKELWNVGYFDGVEAQMDVYKHSGYVIKKPFKITRLATNSGSIDIGTKEENRINKASKLLDNGNISYQDWDIDSVIAGKFETGYYGKIVSESNDSNSLEQVDSKVNKKPGKVKNKKERVAKENSVKKKSVNEKVSKNNSPKTKVNPIKEKPNKTKKVKKSNDDGFMLEEDMFDEIDKVDEINDDEVF